MGSLQIPKKFSVEQELGWKKHVVALISDESMKQLYKAEDSVDEARREVIDADKDVSKGDKDAAEGQNKAGDAENQADGAQSKQNSAPSEAGADEKGTIAKTSSETASQETSSATEIGTKFSGKSDEFSGALDENSTKMNGWLSEAEDFGTTAENAYSEAENLLANANADGENEFNSTYSLKTGAEQEEAQQNGEMPDIPDAPNASGKNSEYQAKIQEGADAQSSAAEIGTQIDQNKSETEGLEQNIDSEHESTDSQFDKSSGTANKEKGVLDTTEEWLNAGAEQGENLASIGSDISVVGDGIAVVANTVGAIAEVVGGVGTGLGTIGGTVTAIGTPLCAVFGLGTPVVGAGGTTLGSGLTVGSASTSIGSTAFGVGHAAASVGKVGNAISLAGTTLKGACDTANIAVNAAQGDWNGVVEKTVALKDDAVEIFTNAKTPMSKYVAAVDAGIQTADNIGNMVVNISEGDYEAAFNDGWNAAKDAFIATAASTGNKNAKNVELCMSTAEGSANLINDISNGNNPMAIMSDLAKISNSTSGLLGVNGYNVNKTGIEQTIGIDLKHGQVVNMTGNGYANDYDFEYNNSTLYVDLSGGIDSSDFDANSGNNTADQVRNKAIDIDAKPKWTAIGFATGQYQKDLAEWYQRHPEAKRN